MESSNKPILLKQIQIVNASLSLTIISTIILSSVIGLQVYKELNRYFFFAWLSVVSLSLLFRIYLFSKNKKSPPTEENVNKWKNLNVINTGISAISYGAIAVSSYFMTNQVSITIVFIVIAGVSAGAVTAYGPIKNLSLLFIFPILTPLIVVNLLYGDIDHFILALTAILFTYIIFSTSNNLYNTFLNTLKQNQIIHNLNEDRHRMEEISKLKSDFFASMSHEIRTPLNGIIGLVELLTKTKLDEHQKDYLDTVKASSNDLLNVINDVLDLSKIEAEKLELLPTKTSLSDFAKRMVVLFSEKAKHKNISLNYSLDNKLPKYIQIDEHRLSQVVSNLISNAIKFTDSGNVDFQIKVINKQENKVKLEFKVKDTGIGIPPEKLNIIFNKYDQIANSSNYLITQIGTGLGLSISKKIIELMEGEIGVESKEKEGSCFWFNIEAEIIEEPHQVNIETKNKEKFDLKVLLVDDREINLKVSSLMLNKLGCTVETATNGEMAIEKYSNSPEEFDLIIMDIQMPVMDGITATKILKEKFTNEIAPIFGLSAQIAKNLHKTPEELGFDYYLTKPLNMDMLKAGLLRL